MEWARPPSHWLPAEPPRESPRCFLTPAQGVTGSRSPVFITSRIGPEAQDWLCRQSFTGIQPHPLHTVLSLATLAPRVIAAKTTWPQRQTSYSLTLSMKSLLTLQFRSTSLSQAWMKPGLGRGGGSVGQLSKWGDNVSPHHS